MVKIIFHSWSRVKNDFLGKNLHNIVFYYLPNRLYLIASDFLFFCENIPVNRSEIDRKFGRLVEQYRAEIQDMLLNHLLNVELILNYFFSSDFDRSDKSLGFPRYHHWHWKNKVLDSHVTQFLHQLHLYFLFLFVCNFHHNLTSNSMLHCHKTRCCSMCNFELYQWLFDQLRVWVYNEFHAVDQSFWYFEIGMFYTENAFSLTLPKLRLLVCCRGKVHPRQMSAGEKVHCHQTKFYTPVV